MSVYNPCSNSVDQPSRIQEDTNNEVLVSSKVSVGEVKLSHKIVPLESLTTRFPLSSSAAIDPSPALMVLVQTVEPLTSVRTR
uniref:Uncharacterized protein n=1 Tax=Oryza barthii TaxID=65489 RepID=A0A0D3ESB5_9ORYZ